MVIFGVVTLNAVFSNYNYNWNFSPSIYVNCVKSIIIYVSKNWKSIGYGFLTPLTFGYDG